MSVPSETVRIDTETDLSGVEATESALDSIPARITSAIDVEADTDTGAIAQARRAARGLGPFSVPIGFETNVQRITDRLDSVLSDRSALIDTETDLAALEATEAALASLPRAVHSEIDVDSDTGAIGETRALLHSLSGRDLSIDIDTEADLSGVEATAAALGGIPDREDVAIDVEADTAPIERVRSAVASLPDRESIAIDTHRITDRLGVGDVVDEATREAMIDITLGDDEREVLGAITEVHGALASLPEREGVAIQTEADLDALVEAMTGLDSLPREVRTEIDVDALTAEAQAGLSAVLAQASAIDSLDPTVDVDADTDALTVLRGGGDDFDFDLPNFGGDRDDDTFMRGVGAVGSSVARLTRTSGAINALRGLGPAATTGALVGGGAALGGLASAVAGAVSAGIGAGIGAAAIGGGLALPVAVNVDEGEVDELKRSVKAALAPLEGGAWEDLQQRIFAGIPQAAGMTASAINSVRSELIGTADEVGDSFWREFPEILAETTDSVRTLDDDIASISIGVLESVPGLIRETTRAGDELLPEFGDLALPVGDMLGSASRLGTGALDLGINAALEPTLDTLATLTPLADLLGDSLHVAGEAAAFVYENIGEENIAGFAGAIQTAVDLAYLFGETVYNVGEARGVWDALGGAIRWVGDALGWVWEASGAAYDALASGAEWALEKTTELHNALNDIPGAAAMSSLISSEDIEMPDLSGGSDGSGPGFGAPAPTTTPTASITADAVASLPSSSTASSSGSTTAAGEGTSTVAGATPAALATGGGATYNQTFNNEVTVNADGTSNTEMRRVARTVHNRLEQQQRRQSGPGT